MKDLEVFLIGLIIAQDAFWIMDTIGDGKLDNLLLKWRLMAIDAGWKHDHAKA